MRKRGTHGAVHARQSRRRRGSSQCQGMGGIVERDLVSSSISTVHRPGRQRNSDGVGERSAAPIQDGLAPCAWGRRVSAYPRSPWREREPEQDCGAHRVERQPPQSEWAAGIRTRPGTVRLRVSHGTAGLGYGHDGV
ncbi:hypothetical protein O1611_g7794 [Lasiodiplodia mahajangana]|uniref:Uncharacterized protein n=1 Tax=Lasiodiplodia mahajangana TaxID=1108764 RepID=A0ACC2JEG9_9PEZI|nr:hypothetical protein O1611_g7794 [Lasiodiplodia mahajangana]